MGTFEAIFAVDDDKSLNGVWIDIGLNDDGSMIQLKIAESGNENHVKAQRRMAKMLEVTRKNEEKHHNVLCQLIAETILLDWKNVLDDNGKQIKATKEERVAYLKQYKKLFYLVLDEASNENNFRPDSEGAKADTEKN